MTTSPCTLRENSSTTTEMPCHVGCVAPPGAMPSRETQLARLLEIAGTCELTINPPDRAASRSDAVSSDSADLYTPLAWL